MVRKLFSGTHNEAKGLHTKRTMKFRELKLSVMVYLLLQLRC